MDKLEFILKLSNETELNYESAKNLVERIPLYFLVMAIEKYENGGLYSLKMFIEGIKHI